MANFAGQATLRIDTGTQDKAHRHRAQMTTAPDKDVVSAHQPFELAAGETVTIHAVSGLDPAGAPNGQELFVWIAVLRDNSASVVQNTQVINTTSFTGTVTGSVDFTPTEAGTYRIRLRARYDDDASNAVVGGYDADTDGAYSRFGTATVCAAAADEASPGYMRAGVAITAVDIDNATAFDGAPVPFAWPDTVRLRITARHAAVASSSSLVIDADTLNVGTPVRDTEITADTLNRPGFSRGSVG